MEFISSHIFCTPRVSVAVTIWIICIGWCSSELTCNMGANTTPQLSAISCTNQTHNFPIRQPDGNISTIKVNHTFFQPEHRANPDPTYCIIYKYNQADKADYMCDYDDLCTQQLSGSLTKSSFNVTGVSHKSQMGTLYCCNSDRCNIKNITSTLPATLSSVRCYHGNGSKIDLMSCQPSTHRCIKTIGVSSAAGVDVLPYSCDHSHLCDHHNIKDNTCGMFQDESLGIQRQICCCSEDGCNDKTFFNDQNVSFAPLSTMSPNSDSNYRSMRHWMFIGGIATAIVFGLLMFLTVAMVIRRCKQKRHSHLVYTYAQLTEDFAVERENSDERMIEA